MKLVVSMTALLVVAGQAEKPSDSPVYAQLKSLECFIGEWECKAIIPEGATSSDHLGNVAGKEVMATLSVRWGPGKSAQIVDMDYDMRGVAVIKGTGVRGWDQSSGQIREYSFTTHKGVWSGSWKKDGETWIFVYQGTNLDG